MADKDTTDIHKATQPKVKEEFWTPNKLEESLKDLDSYEKLSNDLKMNSTDGDRMHTEKHKPVDAHPEIPKTDISTRDLGEENIRENEGEIVSKEVKKVHEQNPSSAFTNLTTASDHAMDLERKIKDSNKSKGGVKYHGDSGRGESRRVPRTDKYKNIDRTKITDVLAALEDVEAFGKLEG